MSFSKITQSPLRPIVDEMLLKGFAPKQISKQLAILGHEPFNENTIRSYRDEHFKSDSNPTVQAIKVLQNIGDNDPSPSNEGEYLASHFTFKSTKEGLDMLYDRIRKLKELADKYPGDPTFDKRISDYIDSAEKIRMRVFRFQYEQVRKAILLTVGKKLCMAAVSSFLPFIRKEDRDTAVSQFERMIQPMLEVKNAVEVPQDIKDVVEQVEDFPKPNTEIITTTNAEKLTIEDPSLDIVEGIFSGQQTESTEHQGS